MKYEPVRECPTVEDSQQTTYSLWRPEPIDPPAGLLELLCRDDWWDLVEIAPDLEACMKDEDGIHFVHNTYLLRCGLEELRDGQKEIVVPPLCPGTPHEMPGHTRPAVPGRPELVKEEWLVWLSAHIPGLLYGAGYTGCV
jgi:hypothetical protein